MDNEIVLPETKDPDQALYDWMASEAFTDFVTAKFADAVKRAFEVQANKGVTLRM